MVIIYTPAQKFLLEGGVCARREGGVRNVAFQANIFVLCTSEHD